MKKLTCLILILCFVFVFIACANDDNNESKAESAPQSSESVEVSSGESSEASEDSEYQVLDKRFDDVVTIFGKRDTLHTYSRKQWEYDNEIKGEAINDAVNNRNQWLLENYGIEIQYIASSSTDYFIDNEVIKMINAGGGYDVVCDGLTTMASLAKNGYLYSLNDASEYLDLSHSWWDNRVTEALSIGGRVYYAAGDILITDDEYTYCLLFCKDLIDRNLVSSDFGGRSLYEVVKDGDWTYDKLFAAAKKCAAITSGGTAMTLDDTWGYVGDIGCLQIMMAGGSYVMAETNNDDIPTLNVASETAMNLFDTLIGYMNDGSYSKFTERFGVEGYYGVAEKMFAEGRIAFYNVKLASLTTILNNTETEVAIGVLPMPKASDDQDNYFNSAAPLHFSCIGIPNSVEEERLDTVCAALEALGYLGQQQLTKAYIETTLKIKRADQTEDADMIDLILTTRCFDLAVVYNWGGLNSFFNKFAGATNTDFKSSWDTISGQAQSDMEDTIAAFLGNEQ